MIKLRIDERLNELGKTWYWLAVETGIGHSVAFNLRHNKVQAIRLDYLESICKALDCTPGDLLVIADEKLEPKKKKAKGQKVSQSVEA